ncbi:MAG: hypothetical protein GX986_07785 [Firmicutes bacterium]|nr:hypothetical protein [Bacillota bacterium]
MDQSQSKRLSHKTLVFQGQLLAVTLLATLVGFWLLGRSFWWLVWVSIVLGVSIYLTYLYTRGHFFDPIRSIQVAIGRVAQG